MGAYQIKVSFAASSITNRKLTVLMTAHFQLEEDIFHAEAVKIMKAIVGLTRWKRPATIFSLKPIAFQHSKVYFLNICRQ